MTEYEKLQIIAWTAYALGIIAGSFITLITLRS
jgi:hypothetical protein